MLLAGGKYGIAPVFASSVTYGDGEWKIDRTFDSAGEFDSVWLACVCVFASTTSRLIRYAEKDGTTQSSTADTTSIDIGTALDFLRLGLDVAGGSSWPGLIAEAAVWDVALSLADFDTLKTGVVPSIVEVSACRGYWPLDESNSTQSNEGQDTAGDLTVTNATFDADHPTIISGLSIPVAMHHYMHNLG